jgi:hypothetical protein
MPNQPKIKLKYFKKQTLVGNHIMAEQHKNSNNATRTYKAPKNQ